LLYLSENCCQNAEITIYAYTWLPWFVIEWLSEILFPCLGPNQRPMQKVPGALSPACQGETDFWPKFCDENETEWSYTSTPPYSFVAWCLSKYRDKFTFYIYRYVNFKPAFTFSLRSKFYFLYSTWIIFFHFKQRQKAPWKFNDSHFVYWPCSPFDISQFIITQSLLRMQMKTLQCHSSPMEISIASTKDRTENNACCGKLISCTSFRLLCKDVAIF
jgi:hypothetical protein